MSKSLKRLRQTTLFENFASLKRAKTMELKGKEEEREPHVREIMAAAAEKRISGSYTDKKENNVKPDGHDSGCSTTMNTESLLEESRSPLNFSQNSDDLFPEEFYSASTITDDLDDPPENSEYDQEDDIQLKRLPDCCPTLPPLAPSETHTVTFKLPIIDGICPEPSPAIYQDMWDSLHVRMPCSPESKCVVLQDGEKSIQSRWDLIEKSLLQDIESSYDLQEAILQYNSQYANRWDFRGLHAFFNKTLKPEEKTQFFESTVPAMVRLALQLPQICTQPIPLLKRQMDHAITLTQKQIACLLANAFFCTFPRRNAVCKRNEQKLSFEYANYPDINFNRLYSGTANGIIPRKAEKLKCLLNYFSRVTAEEPTGTVTFHRQSPQLFPEWRLSEKNICKVAVDSSGVIEVQGFGLLQVDFANKFVGGGVLSQGSVQEEIRFVICPELIISRLFTECLGIAEVLLISGVEQFSRYSGYADSFTWDGDFQDQTPRDAWGRKSTRIVAMDALHYRNPLDQFRVALMQRELNKAFCGFYDRHTAPEDLPAVATGNWGCGVYKGNSHFKFLLQLMATSETHRDMLYFTFQNPKLEKEVKHIYKLILSRKMKVGNIWSLLTDYNAIVIDPSKTNVPPFYEFVCNSLSTGNVCRGKPVQDVSSSSSIVSNGKMNNAGDGSSESTEELTDIDSAAQNEPG